MSINNAKLILSPPIQQNIIDPSTRMPVVGSVFFYKAGTSILKSVYQRSNDPDNPYVAAPNPLSLNAAGALPFSIFAYPVNEADETTLELYDLVVKTSAGVEVLRINNWPETAKQGSTTVNISDEYIVNGQFNYPFEFYSDSNKVGAVKFATTGVCPGWTYETDADLRVTDRVITFEEILNDKANDLPKYICIVDGIAPSTKESFSRLKQEMGPVEVLAGKDITFSFYAQDRNGNGVQLELRMIRNYGPSSSGASASDDILIDTITVTSTLSKFTKTITIPSLEGKTVHEPSSLEIYFSFPTGSAYKIGITSFLGRLGSVSDPNFNVLPESLLNARCLGNSMDYQGYGVADNFGGYTFFNGRTMVQRRTGEYAKVDKDAVQQNMIVLTKAAQSFPVNGANQYGIPYKNLYDVLGNKWGSGGGLIVETKDNILTFTANFEGDPKHTKDLYDGYDGGNTQWGIDKSGIANKYGIVVSKDSSSEATITAMSNYVTSNRFDSSESPGVAAGYNSYQYGSSGPLVSTFSKTYTARYRNNGGVVVFDQSLGLDHLKIVSFAHGTAKTSWNAKISFESSQATDYRSYNGQAKYQSERWLYAGSCLGFSKSRHFTLGYIEGGSVRPFEAPDEIAIVFKVDGVGHWPNELNKKQKLVKNLIEVDLDSTDTIERMVDKFKSTVNNPFKMVFTINRVPTAGEYFKFATKDLRLYAWFEVDGVGIDPCPGDTDDNVKIVIQSNFSFKQIAEAVKSTIATARFTIPSYTDVGLAPASKKDGENNKPVVFM